ncbi:MAG: hypothetical protein ACM3JG_17915 [Thiohalocapsa sp.]
MATSPTDRISAGLEARQRARDAGGRAPQPMALVPPGGRPVPRRTGADLAEQAQKILETEAEVKRIIGEAREEMRAATGKIHEQWAAETAIRRDVAQPIAREKARQAVAEIRQSHKEMLEAIIRDCGASHRALVEQSPLQHSRAQALSLVRLGTPERANLEQTVAKTGRVGLVSLGQEALALMASDDPEKRYQGTFLASVLHLELGSREPADRPFAPSVLVEHAPLQEHDQAARAIRVGNSALTNISKLINDFLGGRDDAPRSLARIMDDIDEAEEA